MTYREWNGNEWQDYCLSLLRVRYANHQLVEIPDRHGGDLGIEAFTHDGVAFQCYAAQEPLSVKDLWEHQRDKLTTDLGKLKKNRVDFVQILGLTKISTYVFMVHRHESRQLVAHAQKKAAEVRGWGLPFIDPNFSITVETDEAYNKERDAVCAIPQQLINLEEVDESHKDDWRTNNLALFHDARRKLKNLNSTGTALESQLNALLDQYLRSENGLESLRARFPENWNRVSKVKSSKENILVLEYAHDRNPGFANIKAIAQELTAEIIRNVPTVDEDLARTFAWGAVADWLFRCPLDFEESA